MEKSRLLLAVLALGAFALPSPATFAQSKSDAPKRVHCVGKKDGKQEVLAAANRKECKQAGGKWRRIKPEGEKS